MKIIFWLSLLSFNVSMASGPYFNIRAQVKIIKKLNNNEHRNFYSVEIQKPYPKLCGKFPISPMTEASVHNQLASKVELNKVIKATIVCGAGGILADGTPPECVCNFWSLFP